MDQLEDRELLIKQYFREMEESLIQKEGLVKNLSQTKNELQVEIEKCNRELEKLKMDLDLAVRKEKDDIARMLIRRQYNQKKKQGQLKLQKTIIEDKLRGILEKMDRQRQGYEKIKEKAMAFNRKAKKLQSSRNTKNSTGSIEGYFITDKEVELELLKVKETLSIGGTP
jgi:phage shock protein A